MVVPFSVRSDKNTRKNGRNVRLLKIAEVFLFKVPIRLTVEFGPRV